MHYIQTHRRIQKSKKKKVSSCLQVVSGYIFNMLVMNKRTVQVSQLVISTGAMWSHTNAKNAIMITHHMYTHTHTISHSLEPQHHNCQQHDHPSMRMQLHDNSTHIQTHRRTYIHTQTKKQKRQKISSCLQVVSGCIKMLVTHKRTIQGRLRVYKLEQCDQHYKQIHTKHMYILTLAVSCPLVYSYTAII